MAWPTSRSEAMSSKGQDDLVNGIQTPLALLDNHWFERGVTITRDVDLDRADAG